MLQGCYKETDPVEFQLKCAIRRMRSPGKAYACMTGNDIKVHSSIYAHNVNKQQTFSPSASHHFSPRHLSHPISISAGGTLIVFDNKSYLLNFSHKQITTNKFKCVVCNCVLITK